MKIGGRKFIAYLISVVLFCIGIFVTKTITSEAWNFLTVVTILYMSANSFKAYLLSKGK